MFRWNNGRLSFIEYRWRVFLDSYINAAFPSLISLNNGFEAISLRMHDDPSWRGWKSHAHAGRSDSPGWHSICSASTPLNREPRLSRQISVLFPTKPKNCKSLTNMMDTKPYSPLDVSSKEIRLLTLHPGRKLSPIRTSLFIGRLSDDPSPVYEALSYVWGPVDGLMHTIAVDGNPFQVRENLWQALQHLRSETVD